MSSNDDVKDYHHGLKYTRAWGSWARMKERCNNKNLPNYSSYGGRGITYDPKWETFRGFYEDMGKCPKWFSLDRIDNDGNYCKENCRWATRTQQNNNQRTRVDNTSRIPGVAKDGEKWRARGTRDGERIHLYKGYDFFEACCARKSWENSHVAVIIGRT